MSFLIHISIPKGMFVNYQVLMLKGGEDSSLEHPVDSLCREGCTAFSNVSKATLGTLKTSQGINKFRDNILVLEISQSFFNLSLLLKRLKTIILAYKLEDQTEQNK